MESWKLEEEMEGVWICWIGGGGTKVRAGAYQMQSNITLSASIYMQA